MSELIFVLILVVVIIVFFVFAYNKLVSNKNRMEEAWAIIDVFLKKRYDLIPELVEITKGYSRYEKNVLESVTSLRTEAMQAKAVQDKSVSEEGLTKALLSLFINVENYPELKANTHFLQLQHQISEVETDLERARRYYNGTVRENNTFMERFPFNIVSKLFNCKKGDFFTIDAGQKEVPK